MNAPRPAGTAETTSPVSACFQLVWNRWVVMGKCFATRRLLALAPVRRTVPGQRRRRDTTFLRDAPLSVTRQVCQQAQSFFLAWSERLLRGYWHLARHWI